jgi:transcriptional regulator with XRE-family HTH domain/Flp pilus assembly protein TadD
MPLSGERTAMNSDTGEVKSMPEHQVPGSPVRKRPASTATGIGERLRHLRISAGFTQSELAGERFSKEYVSQIERGKTRPTPETIEWLASRLRVDASFLANGVSADQRDRVQAGLARAEALTDAGDYRGSVDEYKRFEQVCRSAGYPELELRLLCGKASALMFAGEPREALTLLQHARELSEGSQFSDVERADVLYRLGACRYLLSSTSTALSLLSNALELAERSGVASDLLRSRILHYRARCHVRQRDYEAARDDVERALELAEGLNDRRTLGHLFFQASLLAEREGRWVLARTYAERAKAQYEEIADRANVGRLLNNLGGLHFLLGKPNEAIRYLKDAFATMLEFGSDAEAAEVISSLAQVHLKIGNIEVAEQHARQALDLFNDRDEALGGIGMAQIVLGRALLEQGRLVEAESVLRDADASFAQLSLASQRAAAWIAQGDLATRRGDDRAAARLYRMAAEALQDVRF